MELHEAMPHNKTVLRLLLALGVGVLFGVLDGVQAAEKKKPVEIKIRPIDAKEAAKVSFTRDIKPILVNTCTECHSAEDRKSNFEVTSVETLKQKGKKAGPGVVPGKPDESAIVEYIRGIREPQMPKGSPALSVEELHLIRSWIAAGAKDDSAEMAKAEKSENKNVQVGNLDANTQKILNTLLFENLNAEQKLVLGRKIRLSLLPPAPKPPKVSLPAFNAIDQFIAAKWQSANLSEGKSTPPVCDDNTFIRRVYLDLTGLIPSSSAVRKFVSDSSAEKRSRLIDELLARTDDYAAHWTPFWEEALGSATTEVTGGIGSRGNHRDWIYRSFKENKPFDVMVAELIDPMMPGYQKPVIRDANGKKVVAAYIKNENHEETIRSAANVGQVFMGTGMKCASCHSHFLNKEWPQARFMAFGGLFATNDLEMIRCEKKSGQFIAAKFPFDLPNVPEETPKDLEGRLHRATLLLVDPTNPRFAKTIVNRLWKRYLGLGLFEPVDDFRLDQPPSHPELLEWLADDFMRSGYDLKHTIRLILTSRTYQLRYNPVVEDRFDVQKPTEARYFRSPALRRLTAEQLLDSIRASMTKKWSNKERTYLDKATTPLSRALGRPASRNEISTGRPDDVAVVQSLELLNGPEFYQFVYSGEVLNELAAKETLEKAVEEVYWITLSRPPTVKEQSVALQFLKAGLPEVSPGSEGEAHKPRQAMAEPLGDMLWALFVSPEFQYIH